ncbi:MAG: hypothetical protein E7L01_07050 [Paenibacillus macerans]|uniref:HNH endonuclease n=1 Tax=Paenibacillus TaxID=44249 RepID=UPI00097B9382|nr:hypothetical protein [Paenibacillus macerans]MDU7473100.1 hypothetical protein [Paenibacillus macerans]OMG48706.1 hypothetical protein BK140_15085 [Paenibacillus macerans]
MNWTEFAETSCPVFTTCIFCGQTKPTKEFVRKVKNGRKFKRALYCHECREQFGLEEISKKIQDYKNSEVFEKITDSSLLNEECMYTLKNKYRVSKPITYELAKRYLDEKAAYFYKETPNIIYLKYNRDQLRQFIFERDQHRCYLCGEYAEFVNTILTKPEGGLKTPANMRAVCHKHNRFFQQKQKVPTGNILYALPIYQGHSGKIMDTIENPDPSILKLTFRPDRMYCFCDITTQHDSPYYGICNVVIGGPIAGIQIYTKIIQETPNQTHKLELLAIEEAIQRFSVEKWQFKKAFVFTDIPYDLYLFSLGELGELARAIEEKKGVISIRYLNNQEQKGNVMYRLAHNFARKAFAEFYKEQGEPTTILAATGSP